MTGKIDAFIVDIDGTIALHTEEKRGHFDYSLVSTDTPNSLIISIISRIWTADVNYGFIHMCPIFMSGRADENNGQVRKDTVTWLREYIGMDQDYFHQEHPRLFMRPEFLPDGKRDFRKDDVVKEELYFNHVEPYFNIHFAIDDRPRVLKMWHRLGIPTLAVGTPWIEF